MEGGPRGGDVYILCFSGGTSGKESACNAGDIGDLGSVPGWRRSPGVGHGNPFIPVCLPGESHGQRSLAGYGHWVTKSWTQLK